MEKLTLTTRSTKKSHEKVNKLMAAFSENKDIINDHSKVSLEPEHQTFLDKWSLSEEMMVKYLKLAKRRAIEVRESYRTLLLKHIANQIHFKR